MSSSFEVSSLSPSFILENLGVGAFVHDEEGTLFEVNQPAIEKLGYTRDEFLNRINLADIEVGKEPDALRSLLQDMKPGDTRTIEGQHRTKDGTTFPVEGRISCFTREDSKLFFSLARDITERKRTQAQLQKQTQLLAAINDQMPGVSYQLRRDPDGSYEFEYLSEGFEELTGVSRQHALDDFSGAVQNHLEPKHLKGFMEAIETSARELSPFREELPVQLPDGTKKWFLFSSRPEKLEDESVRWRGVFLDITDLKQTEQKLQQTVEEKETLMEEIHHRVKNNLQMVSSLVGLKMREVENPPFQRLLQTIRERIQSLALVHRILYQSGDVESLDFADYVRKLVEGIKGTLGDHYEHVQFNFDLDEDISLDMNTAIPCGLILNELLTNSFQHAVQSHEAAHEILVGFRQTETGQYELMVSDEGPGLPEDVNPKTSDSLGLRLIHTLVRDQLDGDYTIDREDGTTFRITFGEASSKELAADS